MYHNLLALLAINFLLLGPRLLGHSTQPIWVALEALWLIGLLSLVGRRWRSRLAVVASVALGLVLLLAGADQLIQLSLGRPFNPWLDRALLRPAYHLLVDNVGWGVTWLLLAAGSAAAVACLWLIARALARVRPLTLPLRARRAALVAWLAVFPALPELADHTRTLATPSLTLLAEHWQQGRETRRALSDFRRQLKTSDGPRTRPLPGLAGRDVTLAFIESYGISALTDARYAATLKPRLADLQARFAATGLHVASATVTAPVQGGQSWLAHASVLSGLWLTSQWHYDLLLSAGHSTLIDDFSATGHGTLAIMPAITAPWPAGRQLGYQRILAAADMPYRGPALNWVTMPDQFTWRHFSRVRRAQPQPLFTELAMISSHAPWTPIVPLVDWEKVGNGRIFRAWADAGPTPEALWQDSARVRDHYARSLDYALAAMGGFAERYLGADELLIVLGDHQPAPLITGEDASRDVPIHVISGDPALIERFVAAGFAPGLEPPAGPARWRQDELRGLLHRLFGGEATMPVAAQ
ncbi:alkaline phosphatase [Halomonas sp. HP20-15]|uniref:alkaline phosphatase n=1 Tax=Halomonas sp. HP20-15 TaxID=3085901 RepID=UPI00298250E8|nr:alkaline phosphatase [Halomonas sp. HP20-15]MDW5378313.1 alkaline phosphatase [Halomonas sp. HP20-15]